MDTLSDLKPAPIPDPAATPTLLLPASDASSLLPLLLAGVHLPVSPPCSLTEFLRRTLALSDAFIDAQVKTVFIDGKVVDDFDAALITPGNQIALSGAMPGLVGATLRSGGVLGSLRSDISYRPTPAKTAPARPFLVTTRFYNVLSTELAGPVLAAGFFVPAEKAAGWLQDLPPAVRERVRLVRDGRASTLPASDLAKNFDDAAWVKITRAEVQAL